VSGIPAWRRPVGISGPFVERPTTVRCPVAKCRHAETHTLGHSIYDPAKLAAKGKRDRYEIRQRMRDEHPNHEASP
jgi:hypothetical protein